MAKGLTPLLCVSPLYGHEAGEFFVARYHSSVSDCAQSSILGSLAYFSHLSTLQPRNSFTSFFLLHHSLYLAISHFFPHA